MQGVITFGLPESLDTDAFKAAWQEWITYCKEKRKTLTPSTIKKQILRMEELGPEQAVVEINRSITNNWSGLAEKKWDNLRMRSKRAVNTDGNQQKEEIHAPLLNL